VITVKLLTFKLLSVLVCGLVSISAWSADPLTIATPNGVEIWNSGETQTIKWNEKNWSCFMKENCTEQ